MAWNYYSDSTDEWTTVRYRGGRRRYEQPERREDFRRAPSGRNQPGQHRRGVYTSETHDPPARREHHSGLQRNRPLPHQTPHLRYGERSLNAAPRQNRQQRGPHRRQDTGPIHDHHQQSDDPDFVAKVRSIYKLIKATHHLHNVSQDGDPPAIQRITTNLTSVIKPANPSIRTMNLIEDNAKSWAQTTMCILRQHYTDVRLEERRWLRSLGGDLLDPLEVAVRWATRNLGRRFNPETAEETLDYLLQEEERADSPSSHCSLDDLLSLDAADEGHLAAEEELENQPLKHLPAGREGNPGEGFQTPLRARPSNPLPSPPPPLLHPVMINSATMTDPPGDLRSQTTHRKGRKRTSPPLGPAEDIMRTPRHQQGSSVGRPPSSSSHSPLIIIPPQAGKKPTPVKKNIGIYFGDRNQEEADKRQPTTTIPPPSPSQSTKVTRPEREASLEPREVPDQQKPQINTRQRMTFSTRTGSIKIARTLPRSRGRSVYLDK